MKVTDNSCSLFILDSIFLSGVKLQIFASCLNVYATFSTMYVCFLITLSCPYNVLKFFYCSQTLSALDAIKISFKIVVSITIIYWHHVDLIMNTLMPFS